MMVVKIKRYQLIITLKKLLKNVLQQLTSCLKKY